MLLILRKLDPMKLILLGVIAFLLYTSPQARNASSEILRSTADFLETKEQTPDRLQDPEYFKVPNPFHAN